MYIILYKAITVYCEVLYNIIMTSADYKYFKSKSKFYVCNQKILFFNNIRVKIDYVSMKILKIVINEII